MRASLNRAQANTSTVLGRRHKSASHVQPGHGAQEKRAPSRELPNVGRFDDLVPRFPVRVIFWRQSEQTIAKHWNLNFSKTLGVTLPHTVTVDILHTLHSGIFAEYCKHTVWQLLEADIWGDGTMTHEEKLHASVLALRTPHGGNHTRTRPSTKCTTSR